MSRILYRIGHFAGRHPWRILAAWVLVAVAAVMLNSSLGGQPDETLHDPWRRVADARLTRSRTASRRRRSTRPTSSSTPTRASPRRPHAQAGR